MKKFLPILTLIGASALIVGCGDNFQSKQNIDYAENVSNFKIQLDNYSKLDAKKVSNEKLSKYKMLFSAPNDATLVNSNETELESNTNQDNISLPLNDLESENGINNNLADDQQDVDTEDNVDDKTENNLITDTPKNPLETDNNIETDDNELEQNTNNQMADKKQISTLYSLSNDIEDSCDDFCNLKQEITNAIVETEQLIARVKNKEVELTSEEKIFITEQSQQLKSLAKQLSKTTTELSINLSDINNLSTIKNLDELNLKYLIVLDNLVNGNEMLENGLYTLNMINSVFNTSNLGDNKGRIIHYQQKNNTPPIIQDYSIDKDGNVINNLPNEQSENEKQNENIDETQEKSEVSKKNIDTYLNNNLKSNIDSYYSNTPKNIDTFFNTALLDNEFMYGNGGGYGYNFPMMNGYGMNGANAYGMNGLNNPYNQNNTTYGVNNQYNTQQNTINKNNTTKNKTKKLKINKNVDTYRDENTPTLSTRITNIRNSINGFINKIKGPNKNNKIKNPIYREDIR